MLRPRSPSAATFAHRAAKVPRAGGGAYKFTSGTQYARDAPDRDADFMDADKFDDGCFYRMVFQEYTETLLSVKDSAHRAYERFEVVFETTAASSSTQLPSLDMTHEEWQPFVRDVYRLFELEPTDAYTAISSSGILVKQEPGSEDVQCVGAVPSGRLQTHAAVVMCHLLSPGELMMMFRALALACISGEDDHRKDMATDMCVGALEGTMLLSKKKLQQQQMNGNHVMFPDTDNTLQTQMPLFSRAMHAFAFAALMDHFNVFFQEATNASSMYQFQSYYCMMSITRAIGQCIEATDTSILASMVDVAHRRLLDKEYLKFGSLLNGARLGDRDHSDDLQGHLTLPRIAVDVCERLHAHAQRGFDAGVSHGFVCAMGDASQSIRMKRTGYVGVLERLSFYQLLLFVFMVWDVTTTYRIDSKELYTKWIGHYPSMNVQDKALKKVQKMLTKHTSMIVGGQHTLAEAVVSEILLNASTTAMGFLCDPVFEQGNKYNVRDLISSTDVKFPTVLDVGDGTLAEIIDTDVLCLYIVNIENVVWDVVGVREELRWVANALPDLMVGAIVESDEQLGILFQVLVALAKAWIHRKYFGNVVTQWTHELHECMREALCGGGGYVKVRANNAKVEVKGESESE